MDTGSLLSTETVSGLGPDSRSPYSILRSCLHHNDFSSGKAQASTKGQEEQGNEL